MNSSNCAIVRPSSGKLSPESRFLLSKCSGEGHVARLAGGSQSCTWDVGVCMSPCNTGRAGDIRGRDMHGDRVGGVVEMQSNRLQTSGGCAMKSRWRV